MPHASHRSQIACLIHMRLDYLHWDNQCVLQQIIVHHSVKNINRTIIACAREQRELALMEIDIADCLVVVLKALIGLFTRHVHIEPKDLLVVSAQNQIITLGMDRNAGDPLGTGFIFLDYGLLLQVVLEDADLSGCKEVRFGRMEGKALYDAFCLGERFLGRSFTERMDNDLGGGLDFVSHGREVVTLWVPCKTTYNVLELHCDQDLVFS